MQKYIVITVLVILIAVTGCSTAGKRPSLEQASMGAVLVTGAVAGGAFAGTNIADSNNASDGMAILSGIGGAALFGGATALLYNFILDAFDLKEDMPEDDVKYKEETPDFMLEKHK